MAQYNGNNQPSGEPMSISQQRQPLVGTNADAGPRERGERGVDILDGWGGLVYIQDQDIPQIIALLARHLGGEHLDLIAQEPVSNAWDSYDLDDALTDVDQRLADLQDRRHAILARQEAVEANLARLPISVVEYVSLAQLLLPDVGDALVAGMQHARSPEGVREGEQVPHGHAR